MGHHLHISQRHAVIRRCRDGKVWVRSATQRTGCKTELLFDDGGTADVGGWEILNIVISGGHAAVFKFLLRELSDEERRRREADSAEVDLQRDLAQADFGCTG